MKNILIVENSIIIADGIVSNLESILLGSALVYNYHYGPKGILFDFIFAAASKVIANQDEFGKMRDNLGSENRKVIIMSMQPNFFPLIKDEPDFFIEKWKLDGRVIANETKDFLQQLIAGTASADHPALWKPEKK